jgi:hypothetical protein
MEGSGWFLQGSRDLVELMLQSQKLGIVVSG